MSSPRHVAVIDIGKTNAKLALVDVEARKELTALRRPNRARIDGLYPHHDVEALWAFILDGLASLVGAHSIDAISVTTHGATATLLNERGNLVLPVLDYEFAGPEDTRDAYDEVRPLFAQTGSPPLPVGLNLGAQLYWQQASFPDAFQRTAAILSYPQYWAWRLAGVMASEATSLGCHTDLWNPHAGDFSALVDTMRWRHLFPGLKPANAVLGPVIPEISRQTGLDHATPVLCGIHDSNASLLPHLVDRETPFAVVSTGTWVVTMAVGGRAVELDATRDTLINVSALGRSVPSARFMGGREFERLMADRPQQWNEVDLSAVLDRQTMLLPSVVQGSGPFPDARSHWTGAEPAGGERFVAVSFYMALMTATCLDLVGADGDIVVEGPFAFNTPYLSMLKAVTGRPLASSTGGETGTSIGTAMLARTAEAAPRIRGATSTSLSPSLRLKDYASAWTEAVR